MPLRPHLLLARDQIGASTKPISSKRCNPEDIGLDASARRSLGRSAARHNSLNASPRKATHVSNLERNDRAQNLAHAGKCFQKISLRVRYRITSNCSRTRRSGTERNPPSATAPARSRAPGRQLFCREMSSLSLVPVHVRRLDAQVITQQHSWMRFFSCVFIRTRLIRKRSISR